MTIPHLDKLCPAHRRCALAFDTMIARPGLLFGPLIIWVLAGAGSTLRTDSAVCTMLGLISHVAFWGGFAARAAYLIVRLSMWTLSVGRCRSCPILARRDAA